MSKQTPENGSLGLGGRSISSPPPFNPESPSLREEVKGSRIKIVDAHEEKDPEKEEETATGLITKEKRVKRLSRTMRSLSNLSLKKASNTIVKEEEDGDGKQDHSKQTKKEKEKEKEKQREKEKERDKEEREKEKLREKERHKELEKEKKREREKEKEEKKKHHKEKEDEKHKEKENKDCKNKDKHKGKGEKEDKPKKHNKEKEDDGAKDKEHKKAEKEAKAAAKKEEKRRAHLVKQSSRMSRRKNTRGLIFVSPFVIYRSNIPSSCSIWCTLTPGLKGEPAVRNPSICRTSVSVCRTGDARLRRHLPEDRNQGRV